MHAACYVYTVSAAALAYHVCVAVFYICKFCAVFVASAVGSENSHAPAVLAC